MAKRLGGFDSWLIGVAAMLGAGVFAVFGPAYRLVGEWLWLAVVLAGAIATVNALSVSWLAKRYPSSGAGYRYSAEVIGPRAGFVTGLAFLIGKSGSVAAAALVISGALQVQFSQFIAVAVIGLAVLLNFFGMPATARGVRFLAIPTFLTLSALLIATPVWLPIAAPATLPTSGFPDPTLLLGATGLFFFAFAGYARIATLAGEVSNPARTVPRSMLLALATTLLLYVGFALVLPAVLGDGLGANDNTLLALAEELGNPWPLLVRVVLLLAAGASLLVLLAALSRTSEVMASDGELPRLLTTRSRYGSPWKADLGFGFIAAAIAVSGQVVLAISISACLVLVYYAFAHLAVLRSEAKGMHRLIAVCGLVSCLFVSVFLGVEAIGISVAALALGLLIRELIAKFRRVE